MIPEANVDTDLNRAASATATELSALLYHRAESVLDVLIENPSLGEQHLLILLSRRDLSRKILLKIARNREWMNSYSLKLAVLRHPQTPRSVALPLLKFIFLFDLLTIALEPGAAADLKRLAEDAILAQKEGVALGQRISLARRGSQRVAAALLGDSEASVITAALSNPRLTSSSVANALLLPDGSPHLTEIIANHPRWSGSRPVKLALARSQHLTLGRRVELLSGFSAGELADFASDSRVDRNVRAYAARMLRAAKRSIPDKSRSI